MIESMAERVNADDALVRRGRWVDLSFLLGIGETEYMITIREGRVERVAPRGLATETGRFSIRAEEATWREFWRPVPKRDYHDIWSMLPKGLASLDGDLLPLIQNLQYFKDVLAAPRASEG
jgi:hypothetical protein